MPIKAVLFDIDGTLVDSNDYHIRAWERAFAEIGACISRDAIHAQIGKGTDMLVPALLPDLDAQQQEALGRRHGSIFQSDYLGSVCPFPRAHDLLARSHAAGLRIVLASSASKDELDHYLDLLDATALVETTTTSDDVKKTKPAPDIFAKALSKLGSIEPRDVIVVGDTPYDIEAAARCGIEAIGVRSGKFADAVLRKAGAIALYDDVSALLDDYDQSPLATFQGVTS